MSNPFDTGFRSEDTALNRSMQLVIDRLGDPSFLERSFLTPLRGQTYSGIDFQAYARTSTTTFEDWYPAGGVNATTMTTLSLPVNTLVAIPFVATKPYTIDGVAFEVTTVSGASGKARVGIYEASPSSSGLFYPGALFYDAGEYGVAAATGAKKTTGIALSLTVGRLYFAAYICGTAAPTIRAMPVGMSAGVGQPAALGVASAVAYTVASTYSSATGLPASFPASAGAYATTFPAIFFRYATPFSSARNLPVRCPSTNAWELTRANLLSSSGVAQQVNEAYFTVSSAVRSGGAATVLGTYDSRSNRLRAGVAFPLTGSKDLARRLSAGDLIEVQVAQFGPPLQDLSDMAVETVLTYIGSA